MDAFPELMARLQKQDDPDEFRNKYQPKQAKKELEPDELCELELRESLGKYDPTIKPAVEKHLREIDYRRKTRAEAGDILMNYLDQDIKKIIDERQKLMKPKPEPELFTFEPLKDPGSFYDVMKMLRGTDEDKKEEGKKADDKDDKEKEEFDFSKLIRDRDEAEFEKGLRSEDFSKMESILLKRREKLQEYEERWNEKKNYNDTFQTTQSHVYDNKASTGTSFYSSVRSNSMNNTKNSFGSTQESKFLPSPQRSLVNTQKSFASPHKSVVSPQKSVVSQREVVSPQKNHGSPTKSVSAYGSAQKHMKNSITQYDSPYKSPEKGSNIFERGNLINDGRSPEKNDFFGGSDLAVSTNLSFASPAKSVKFNL